MPLSGKEVVRQWFEHVWNRKDAAAIDRLASPQCIVHGLAEGGTPDIAGFRAFHQAFCSAYPDIRIEIEDLIEEGDQVAWRLTFRGTHSGPGLGIAATGRGVSVGGIGIVRVQNGRIVEAWNQFDRLGMMGQLGVGR